MGDAGVVERLLRYDAVSRLLVERAGLDLRPERELLRAPRPRLFLEEGEERASDPAAADVVDHRHPPDLRLTFTVEDETAGRRGNAVPGRHRVNGALLIVLVHFHRGRHSLLLDEHGPPEAQAELPIRFRLSQTDVHHRARP